MASIKLINDTQENIRIAIFKKPYKSPSLKVMAWQTINPQQDCTQVEIPDIYEVYINYSLDPAKRDDPYAGIKSNVINIDVQSARFLVTEGKTPEGKTTVSLIRRYTGIVENEIQIENQASFGVWGHLLLNGLEVYPPQIISPGRTVIEDVTSPHFIAVSNENIIPGQIFHIESLKSDHIKIWDGITITVVGSKHTGYSITIS